MRRGRRVPFIVVAVVRCAVCRVCWVRVVLGYGFGAWVLGVLGAGRSGSCRCASVSSSAARRAASLCAAVRSCRWAYVHVAVWRRGVCASLSEARWPPGSRDGPGREAWLCACALWRVGAGSWLAGWAMGDDDEDKDGRHCTLC